MIVSAKVSKTKQGGGTMNIKPESEIISEDQINLYDYWKIIVKRKNIFIGIFLVPLVIVTIISLNLPSYYRGESEISFPALPASNTSIITAPNIVSFIGNIDDTKKVKIFANNSGAIKNVLISLSKNTTDKINIIIDAKTVDIMPQAFKDVFDYISNLPVIKNEIAKAVEQTDLKIKNLNEVRKANLIFLNQMTDMMKKRQLQFININPADLIMKDGDLSLEIINLQHSKTELMKKKELNVKVNAVILGPPTITKQPSNAQIKRIIIITCIISFLAGIFIVFLLEYIDRMKARESK
jgi:hypothetical protein